MAFYLSPSVNVKEIDLSGIIPAVATTPAGFAGRFTWGPVEKRVLVDNEGTLRSIFGKPNNDNFQHFFTSANFLAYGGALWNTRVVGTKAAYFDTTKLAVVQESFNAVTKEEGPYAPSPILIKNEDDYNNKENVLDGVLNNGNGPDWVAKYPGELGNSLRISVADTNGYLGWVYASLFDTEPGENEFHIAVIDQLGYFTGTPGTALERFAYVSTVAGTKYLDGSSAYILDVINNTSKYLWVGDKSQDFTNYASVRETSALVSATSHTVSGFTFTTQDELAISVDGVVVDQEAYSIGVVQATSLDVTYAATSDNLALLPNNRIYFAGDNTHKTVVVRPLSGQSGNAIVTVSVTDNQTGDVSYETFEVYVAGPSGVIGSRPTITDAASTKMQMNPATGTQASYELTVTVADADTGDTVAVTATSSNQTLLPDSSVVTVDNNDGTFTITATPEAGKTGVAVVTISATDDATTPNTTLESYAIQVIDSGATDFDTFVAAYPSVSIINSIDIAADADPFEGHTQFTVTQYTNGAGGSTPYTIYFDTAQTGNLIINKVYSKSFHGGYEQAYADGNLEDGYDQYADSESVDVAMLLAGPNSSLAIANYLINIAEDRKDCIALLSVPQAAVVANTGDELTDSVAYRDTLPSTSYAVLDSGYKYQYDRYNDTFRWVPLNGDIGGLIARTDEVADPWFSPGGYNRGQIKNVIKLAWSPNKAQRDVLYPKGINAVITTKGEGTILYGDKTLLARPSAFDRINVRRLFIVLEKAIATASKQTLFELNDQFTRAQFKNMVDPYLRDIQGRRGIYDFKVVCDETNNTGEVIDRNEFVADIYIKPARSINYIILNFVAVRTGIQFSEAIGKF